MDKTKVIIGSLTTEWTTTKAMVKLLKPNLADITKKDVNKALYAALKEKDASGAATIEKKDGTPPMWRKISTADEPINEESSNEDQLYIFIDGDNSSCLKEVEPYANDSSICVTCVVSPNYPGYEPSTDDSYIAFKRINTEAKYAAVARLMLEVTQICERLAQHNGNIGFLIVSKSELCATYVELLEDEYQDYSFEIIKTSWDGLRDYIE